MKSAYIKLLSILTLFTALNACGVVSDSEPPGTPQPTSESATPTTEFTEIPPLENVDLTLWVAPEFAPDPDTPAGALLSNRLRDFEAQYPRVDVSVRVKNSRGQGGLLDALSATSSAAPSALPDLITLDPTGIHFSFINDLITPIDGLIKAPESPAWYEFAGAASRIDGEFVGYPFASNTEILAYRTELYEAPPTTWEELIREEEIFLFPAGDPNAAFTVGQYLSKGGQLVDENGQPFLDQAVLMEVLSLYEAAREAGVVPLRSLDFSDSKQTFEELNSGRAASSITPLNSYLTLEAREGIAALPAPAPDKPGISLTETLSWGVVTRDPDRQALVVSLMEWLADPNFLGAWTRALGMLPPTSASLDAWPDGDDSALASSLVTLAQPRPADTIYLKIGPPIWEAVSAVLQGIETPANAALQAVDNLQSQ